MIHRSFLSLMLVFALAQGVFLPKQSALSQAAEVGARAVPEKCEQELIDLAGVNLPQFNDLQDRLLLFAPPKTASTSLRAAFGLPSLKPAGGDDCMYVAWDHVERAQKPCASVADSKLKIHDYMLAKQFMERPSQGANWIITPLRHILQRVPSNFFQQIELGVADGKENSDDILGQSMDDMFSRFSTYWQQHHGTEVVTQFKNATGVDLASYSSMDFSDGGLLLKHTCGLSPPTYVILLRVEDSEHWDNHLQRLFPASVMEWPSGPKYAAEDKWYSCIYQKFKEAYAHYMSVDDLQRMSAHCEQSQFYSKHEINGFIEAVEEGTVASERVCEAET